MRDTWCGCSKHLMVAIAQMSLITIVPVSGIVKDICFCAYYSRESQPIIYYNLAGKMSHKMNFFSFCSGDDSMMNIV